MMAKGDKNNPMAAMMGGMANMMPAAPAEEPKEKDKPLTWKDRRKNKKHLLGGEVVTPNVGI